MMTVYFIRRVIDGAIKIGFTSREPLRRMREIHKEVLAEIGHWADR